MAAAAHPYPEVRQALINCGVTSNHDLNVFCNTEQFHTLADFTALTDDAIVKMAARMASRTQNSGLKVTLGTMQIVKIQALVYWIKDQVKLGFDVDALDPDDFTAEVCTGIIELKEVDGKEDDKVGGVDTLPKFDPDDFDACDRAFVNMLSGMKGAIGEELVYVVRDPVVPTEFVDDVQERMFEIAHEGPGYQKDSRTVYQLLESYLQDHPGAFSWIEGHRATQDGREAYLAWTGHYNGDGELTKRVSYAKARLERIYYRNEQSYPFERFTSELARCFVTLDKKPSTRMTDTQKVDHLFSKIQNKDATVAALILMARRMYHDNFIGCCNYMSGEISEAYAGAHVDRTSRKNKRQISALGQNQNDGRGRGRGYGGRYNRYQRGGGGRGGGRYGGRGGGQRGGGRGNGRRSVYFNNVNVTDFNRTFSPQEWDQMGGDGRRFVENARMHGRTNGQQHQQGGQQGTNNQNVGAVAQGNQQGQAQEQNQQNQGRGGNDGRGGRNGRAFGRGYGNNGGRY